jgi:hypothetical protein
MEEKRLAKISSTGLPKEEEEGEVEENKEGERDL